MDIFSFTAHFGIEDCRTAKHIMNSMKKYKNYE
jgi:hypothetical protein